MPLPKTLSTLLRLPTAAFTETAVLAFIKDTCRRLSGVTCRPDRHGNLLACYRHRPGTATPLVFAAHTDHPAFVAREMADGRTLRADFRGGVLSNYFAGGRVRFWSGGHWIKARVQEVTKTLPVPTQGPGVTRPTEALLRVSGPVERDAPGIWDLPDPVLKGDVLHAGPCDDLAGVAALLELLTRLSRKRAQAEVHCLFTRAEEVGFIGAIAAAKSRSVPRKRAIIAIEMSKALPNARIGDGPVLRVGDRLSTFSPELTAFCRTVADQLTKRRKKFAYQRKLMDGGACESTAYSAFGYQTTCICLPLGNYHNMDAERGRIAPEYISITDWRNMTDWFEALVLAEPGFGPSNRIREDLERSFSKFEALLGTRRRTR